jgi:glycosyltransferase involved in cell wall biosynthesis
MVGPVQITNSAAEGDNPRVKWLGPVTRNQAADKYRSADVFILPTLSDGFAITQLEAQAYGLPVISSKFCASAVQNGRNGIVLEGPTAACIAAAIRDCVANPKRLETFAASSGLPNQFTMDTLGQRLQELGSTL